MTRLRWILFLLLCDLIPCQAGMVQSPPADSVAARFHRSLELEQNGQINEAIHALNDVATSDYLVVLRLGWLHYQNKDYDRSRGFYEDALRLSQNRSVEALLGVTLPLAAEDKWDEVERAYQRILALDPKQYDANLRLGQIDLNRRDYAAAEPHLVTVQRAYPGHYEPNLSLGWTLYHLGRTDEARTCFMRALMLSPDDASAKEGLKLVP